MPNDVSLKTLRSSKWSTSIAIGLFGTFLFFVTAGYIAYNNIGNLRANMTQVTRTHDTILALNEVLALMKDAETGQRGYLLTGDDAYLEPYRTAKKALISQMTDIEGYTTGTGAQQASIVLLRKKITEKFDEMESTIAIRETQGLAAAIEVVKKDEGKVIMDDIRTHVKAMQAIEANVRVERIEEMNDVYRTALVGALLTSIVGIILAAAVALLMQRAYLARIRQQWLKDGEVLLKNALLGELKVDTVGENTLAFFGQYFGAKAGVFYAKNGNDYRRTASFGVPAGSNIPDRFDLNDGLLGQAVKNEKTLLLNNVPDGYLTIGSAMGQDKPRHLIISPTIVDNHVNGVVELGFFEEPDEISLKMLETATLSIGVALKAAEYRAHLQNLLEETQRQAEELQTQSEELRVSNEELEEQGRVLKESQARLEQQQVEMEQTNAQLEEQTQLLEIQKDNLQRTNLDVQTKARELEQASQYKSDFLANMSHELRTPLNSSLILAKLLADNPQGNLTAEQVKFAQTIQSAGNDLLNLINDILDLSKIEAGHMEVQPEPVPLNRLADEITRLFQPLATQKNLKFSAHILPGCPEAIETDRMRLEQVLKNLLSNAIKFTEKGSVELLVKADAPGNISFTVKDTGIGITAEQQATIFDAFRQADGTISRKYGGTGLGLSISRELTRLLGGKISVTSQEGKGSAFTLVLPAIFSQQQENSSQSPHGVIPVEDITAPLKEKIIHDDREKITSSSRSILIIEDDISFARIVSNMAHDLDFLSLVANTAADGITMAKQYLPSAIILDIGLPDNSGLTVLDRLKHNPHTRHIPIHVISADDRMQTALALGAIGYMLKPVKHEELSGALKKLESRLLQNMRRILLVEDDEVQRDSVKRLLEHKDIEIIDVGTASECFRKLEQETFDCMIMDLSLPDASGFSLLETLSREDSYSFPPVIVYTGRELTNEEEQKLRRYSKSIIIKGAKSPERLLDEVTLFLHQVVSDLPAEQQAMLKKARNRDAILENRRILVVEDDMRNIYSLTSILEPHGVSVEIARNGREAITMLEKAANDTEKAIDLVLMDVMMPEMDGLTATREIRKNSAWRKLPIIMLTAKAMKDDQEKCMAAGANDYMAKPLDVEKLLSLVRVWIPR